MSSRECLLIACPICCAGLCTRQRHQMQQVHQVLQQHLAWRGGRAHAACATWARARASSCRRVASGVALIKAVLSRVHVTGRQRLPATRRTALQAMLHLQHAVEPSQTMNRKNHARSCMPPPQRMKREGVRQQCAATCSPAHRSHLHPAPSSPQATHACTQDLQLRTVQRACQRRLGRSAHRSALQPAAAQAQARPAALPAPARAPTTRGIFELLRPFGQVVINCNCSG